MGCVLYKFLACGLLLLMVGTTSAAQATKVLAAPIPIPSQKNPQLQLPDPHTDCLSCHAHGAISPPSTTLAPSKPSPEGKAAKARTRDQALPLNLGLATTCLGCHEGPKKNAADLATKLDMDTTSGSTHINWTFLQQTRTYSRTVSTSSRKVKLMANCNGCHDVHAKTDPARLSQLVFDTSGQLLSKAKRTTVAQICFGCHAGPEAVHLPFQAADVGARFAGTGSAHVIGSRTNSRQDLPSLRLSLFQGFLDCTSCHANPDPIKPKGPHSSTFPNLLLAAYGKESGPMAVGGGHSNDLCFVCHDKNAILGNQSFPYHSQHIAGFTGPLATSQLGRLPTGPGAASFSRGGMPNSRFVGSSQGLGVPTPCATCHDPHGSPTNPALISFDTTVVSRSSVGAIKFQRTGFHEGACTLLCHGYDHVQTRY